MKGLPPAKPSDITKGCFWIVALTLSACGTAPAGAALPAEASCPFYGKYDQCFMDQMIVTARGDVFTMQVHVECTGPVLKLIERCRK